MIRTDEFPPGYLKVAGAVLLLMALNAAVLTSRDLGALPAPIHPLLRAAVLVAAVGAGLALLSYVVGAEAATPPILCAAAAVAALLAAASPEHVSPDPALPWTYHLGFVGMIAAAVCLRPRWIVGYSALVLAAEALTTPFSLGSTAILLVAALSVVVYGLVIRRTAQILSATQRADRRAAEMAVERVRAAAADAARDRWEAWAHDNLLVTLRLGAQGDPSARDMARDLLGAGLGRPDPGVSDLRAAVQAEAARLRVRVRWDVTRVSDPPGPVELACSEAITEAIRNVARHAGTLFVSVTGELSGSSADVTIRDAGAGFDSGTAAFGVGIRSSIIARMQAVGGSAEVRSEAGAGTAVRIRWHSRPLPEPSLVLWLDWAVLAVAGITALTAVRAWLILPASSLAWVSAGLVGTLVAALVITRRARLAPAALAGWLVACAILTATAPAAQAPEGQHWLGIGAGVVFVAAARSRRELLGVAFALATFLTQVAIGVWLRPDLLQDGWGFWLQPVVYAALAALGITLVSRLQRRYGRAQARVVEIEEQLVAERAEREEDQRRRADLPAGVLGVLGDLATLPEISTGLAAECGLMEAATRDFIAAPDLAHPELAPLLRRLRQRGAYVTLGTGAAPRDAVLADAVLGALCDIADVVGPRSRVTVHRSPGDPEWLGTVTVTDPAPAGAGALRDVDAFVDEGVVQVRLPRPAPTHADAVPLCAATA